MKPLTHQPSIEAAPCARLSLLVLGTCNHKKRAEIAELLELPGLELRTLDAFDPLPPVEEDGDSFLANAEKKARQYALGLRQWVLGEDSGLVVDALRGAPGIRSARYAGEPCDDERNNDRLLAELADIDDPRRTAHYVCAAVVCDPDGNVRASAEGRCYGRIARRRAGNNGFGYDPLFFVPEAERTFGELPPEYKQRHSHRSAALRQLRPPLIALMDAP